MHTNDVRITSRDARYQGLVFSGPIDEAIEQASSAWEYPLPVQPVKFKNSYKTTQGISRDRYNLLNFLGLLS